MSHWNYRVLKKKWNENFTSFAVCEVYYDNEGKPTAWIWEKNVMNTYDYEGLKSNIDYIREAFDKPTLEIMGDDEYLVEIPSE